MEYGLTEVMLVSVVIGCNTLDRVPVFSKSKKILYMKEKELIKLTLSDNRRK
jgi:hypothetical protein